MSVLSLKEKYASWKGQLDEEFLLNITGVKQLEEIEDLELCKLNLCDGYLKPEVLNKLTSVVELNLSGNNLTCIPAGIKLGKLRYLDISHNQLTSVEWLKRFPDLIDLDLNGNVGLAVEDRYKATFLLEKLKILDKKMVDESDKLGQPFTKNLLVRIEKLWNKEFSKNVPDSLTDKDVSELRERFATRAKERIHYGPNSLKAYRIWRVNSIARELVNYKIECPGGCLLPAIIDDEPSGKEVVLKSIDNKHSGKNGNTSKAAKRKSDATSENSYSAHAFLQCHSKENGPNDFSTQVWCCTFEPDMKDETKTSNLVATCGGDTVCITDCTTAQVQMRFQQNNEEFYVVAWTTMDLNGHKSNILVSAGCLGFIHLLHPKQGICYGRIKAHSSPIQTVHFSPFSSTHLLTGDKKGNIYLLDIDVPTVPEYKFSWKKLMSFVGVDATPLKFCVPPVGGYLLSATEYGLHCWKSEGLMRNHKAGPLQTVSVLCELCFPGVQESEPTVDSLTMLTDGIVATKVAQQGSIFLWKFSDVQAKLNNLKPEHNESILLPIFKELKWSLTKHCFINIGTCKLKCSIISGDEVGNIWIYDLRKSLDETASYKAKRSKPVVPDNVVEPSAIIPFPKCTNTSGDVLMKFRKGTIYNDISCSSNMEFIVVTADTNLVGIYKKAPQ